MNVHFFMSAAVNLQNKNVEELYNWASYADDLTILYEGVELSLGITKVNISDNRPPYVSERLF
jgi:hypothetical protein